MQRQPRQRSRSLRVNENRPRVQFTPSGYLGDLNDMIQRAHKQQGDRGTHAMLYMLVELEIQARIGR